MGGWCGSCRCRHGVASPSARFPRVEPMKPLRERPRTRRGIAILAASVFVLAGFEALARPAAGIQPPVAFSAAPLPTWQGNRGGYATASAQGLVFAGGSFTRVRPPAEPDVVTTTNADGTTTTSPGPLTKP